MLKKEKDNILLKLDEMHRYAEELKEIIPDNEEYLKNMVKRRACEKTIGLAIGSLIDVCSMIISIQKLGVPSDEESIFHILNKKDIISDSLNQRLIKMKGFRNIGYGDVDDTLAYETLSNDINDFDEFSRIVEEYLKNL